MLINAQVSDSCVKPAVASKTLYTELNKVILFWLFYIDTYISARDVRFPNSCASVQIAETIKREKITQNNF